MGSKEQVAGIAGGEWVAGGGVSSIFSASPGKGPVHVLGVFARTHINHVLQPALTVRDRGKKSQNVRLFFQVISAFKALQSAEGKVLFSRCHFFLATSINQSHVQRQEKKKELLSRNFNGRSAREKARPDSFDR